MNGSAKFGLICVVCLILSGLNLASGDQADDYTTVAEFGFGTDQELLQAWSIPEPFQSTVTRLATAVVLIEDGTARVLRIDHDVRKEPAEAQVCLDASRSVMAVKDFRSLVIRHRALRYHAHFRVVLLDQTGQKIPGPLLHAGPDYFRTDELRPSDFTWPDPKPEKLYGLALVIRKEDDNRKGTLLLQWIRWR